MEMRCQAAIAPLFSGKGPARIWRTRRGNDMDIGDRIKQIRGKASRAEFAEKLGIHQQTLYLYEKGKRVVDVELLQRICSECSVSVEWLIFGTEQLQTAVSSAEDEKLRRELAEKEERIHQLQNELILAQSGALKAYDLALGSLQKREGDG